MCGLLYYIPSANGVGDDLVKAHIAHAFEAPERGEPVRVTRRGTQHGPDDADGVILADHQHMGDQKIGFYKEKQRWKKLPAPSPAWVGFYVDDPPTPADLERRTMLAGHLVELGDGHRWMIPVARALVEQGDELLYRSALPERLELDDHGHWSMSRVLAQYEPLMAIAQRWFDQVTAAVDEADGTDDQKSNVAFTFQGGYDACADVLAANYRIGRPEISLLGLFTEAFCREVFNALIDWPTMDEWLKKKTQSGAPAG